ncbi:MAG: putative nucleotidyltransferase substrate binding domain-containing protein [Pseudomonadota bacterium]
MDDLNHTDMTQPQKFRPSPLEVLSETRTFKDLDRSTLGELISASKIRLIPTGGVLYRAGDPYQERVYILFAGTMVTHWASRADRDLPIGYIIGLANYLDNAPFVSTTVATTRCALLEVSAEVLRKLEQDRPDLFNLLARIIARRLREISPDRSISIGFLAQPVSSLMKTTITTCGPDMELQAALKLMKERGIGSLVVTTEDGRLKGVLTFAGLAEAMILHNARPDDKVITGACEKARTISPDTPLWKAEQTQLRSGAKYLIVVENGIPVGLVSQTDFLYTLAYQPSNLANQISDMGTIKELTQFNTRIVDVAAEAQETNRSPSVAVRYLSEIHLAIQRRAIEFTLGWMEKKGYGPSPVGFAVLIMGSGGRKEMLLTPDQDNGLIIEDTPDLKKPEVQEWFQRFSKRMNRNLDRVGYELCRGDIMASNPMYRKTLSQWKKQITYITKKPTEKAARWSNIMFDFDTLYGDDNLTSDLRLHVLSEVQARPRLLRMMALHDAEGRPAIGFFNQLISTEKGKRGEHVDLKRNGLRIVVDAARIFSLQNGVAAQNTTERLRALVRVGKISADFNVPVNESYEELLDMLLTHQIQQARKGKSPDKIVNLKTLSERRHGTLRVAMRAIKRFQQQLQGEFEI